jgi:hypothetical protein
VSLKQVILWNTVTIVVGLAAIARTIWFVYRRILLATFCKINELVEEL